MRPVNIGHDARDGASETDDKFTGSEPVPRPEGY